jgi:hypothetical protein
MSILYTEQRIQNLNLAILICATPLKITTISNIYEARPTF